MIRNIFIWALVTTTLTLISCSGNNGSSPGTNNSASSASLTDADVADLSQYQQGAVQSDIQNVNNGPGMLGGQVGAFEFPLWGAFFMGGSNCVTVTNTSSGTTTDILFTYACTDITGTVEIKGSKATGDSSFEIITNIDFSDSKGSSATTDSTYSVSNVAGVVTISKQVDDTFTDGTNTYGVTGTSTDVITPTSATNPMAGGTISLSSSYDFTKNGTDEGTFTVSSSGLAYSSCGLDAGSITITKGSNTYVTTFTGCGMSSLTKNGTPVTWPLH